jgi:hypothetical protein
MAIDYQVHNVGMYWIADFLDHEFLAVFQICLEFQYSPTITSGNDMQKFMNFPLLEEYSLSCSSNTSSLFSSCYRWANRQILV